MRNVVGLVCKGEDVCGVTSVPSYSGKAVVSSRGGVKVVSAAEKDVVENSWSYSATQARKRQRGGAFFSCAAQLHAKSKAVFAVQEEKKLLWWPQDVSSLDHASSHAFPAPVLAALHHKRLDELLVCLRDGRVCLFNFETQNIVSQIGENLEAVWAGIVSLSKIVHVVLVVKERSTYHLRVIRVLGKKLEHVCAHQLNPPKGCVKIVACTFGDFVLSCMWDKGTFASYDFGDEEQLAPLNRASAVVSPVSVGHFEGECVFESAGGKQVCILLKDSENPTFVSVHLFNTMYGALSQSLLSVDVGGEKVGALVSSSNGAFFLFHTPSAVFRVNVAVPPSSSLLQCLLVAPASQPKGKRGGGDRWGRDSRSKVSQGSATLVLKGDSWELVPARDTLEKGETSAELLSRHIKPGTGHTVTERSKRTATKKDNNAEDRYPLLTPETLSSAGTEEVEALLQLGIFSVAPPKLVASLLQRDRVDAVRVLLQNSPALSYTDMLSILLYSLSHEKSNLFRLSQTCDSAFREILSKELDAVQLQQLFSRLCDLLVELLSSALGEPESLGRVLDWLCCVLDSNPQTFALDPQMKDQVTKLLARVDRELERTEILGDVNVILDVVASRQVPVPKERVHVGEYSIEYLVI